MKFVLFILAACLCFVGCNPPHKAPTEIQPVEKPQTPFFVMVDSNLLPSRDQKMEMTEKIRISLTAEADKLGIPLTVWRVTSAVKKGEATAEFALLYIWNVTCSVQGVDDIDTLKCIANTLIKIPFVKMVGNHDFQVLQPRK